MSKTIAATFETRRDAEMAVEHLVQEHRIDRKAVTIAPVSAENSAGTATAETHTRDRCRVVPAPPYRDGADRLW